MGVLEVSLSDKILDFIVFVAPYRLASVKRACLKNLRASALFGARIFIASPWESLFVHCRANVGSKIGCCYLNRETISDFAEFFGKHKIFLSASVFQIF